MPHRIPFSPVRQTAFSPRSVSSVAWHPPRTLFSQFLSCPSPVSPSAVDRSVCGSKRCTLRSKDVCPGTGDNTPVYPPSRLLTPYATHLLPVTGLRRRRFNLETDRDTRCNCSGILEWHWFHIRYSAQFFLVTGACVFALSQFCCKNLIVFCWLPFTGM